MTAHTLSLTRLRREMATAWILAVSGVAFAASQLMLAAVIHRIGWLEFLRLQCLAVRASDYLRVFSQWEQDGVLDLYRGHLILDELHWVWYTIFFTAALARLFQANNISDRYSFVLVLPLVSGILDLFENRLQHFFLSGAEFSTVVDPLPLFSTIASALKWLVAASYVVILIVLGIRQLSFRSARKR